MAPTTAAVDRRALPTFGQAATLIGIHPSGVGRAVTRLGITPIEWGGREKRLTISDLMRVATHARRATVNEVAAGLLADAQREHPDQVAAIQAEIDRYLAQLYATIEPEPGDRFLAEVTAALPDKHARTVERIYRRYTGDAS